MANRTISAAGIALIKRFEGCRLTAYKCSAGVWTIGYGHTSGVYAGMRITQAQAEAFFQADCRKIGSYVNNPAYVPQTEQLNQNQFDALVSFVFNLGPKWLKSLCDNGRTLAQIAAAMPQYRRASGQVLPGLVQRRAAEVALFNTPVTTAPANQPAVKVAEVNQESEEYNMRTIRKGSKGNMVKVWQIIVGATPDGNFGGGTESKTKSWQSNHGLSADGVVGPKSWKAGLESL